MGCRCRVHSISLIEKLFISTALYNIYANFLLIFPFLQIKAPFPSVSHVCIERGKSLTQETKVYEYQYMFSQHPLAPFVPISMNLYHSKQVKCLYPDLRYAHYD